MLPPQRGSRAKRASPKTSPPKKKKEDNAVLVRSQRARRRRQGNQAHKNLPRRRSENCSHFRPISVSLIYLALAVLPIPALSLSIHLSLSSSGVSQTPPVTPTLHLQLKSYFRSVRTPKQDCEFFPTGLIQRRRPLQMPCHIAARSGQCDTFTAP